MVAAAAAAAAGKSGGSGAGKALKYLSLFPIAYLSLLAGASIVHNIYKPDLVRVSCIGVVWCVASACGSKGLENVA